MRFDKSQTIELYNFYLEISKIIFAKLKPGGFFLSFSAPRLIHAIMMAIDVAGFEIRDCINWIYTQTMPKGMSVSRSIDKMNITEKEKEKLKTKYSAFKTPMIRSCYEPICVAMKPIVKTFLHNELIFNCGLVDFSQYVGIKKVPSNIITTEKIEDIYDLNFLVKKPTKKKNNTFKL